MKRGHRSASSFWQNWKRNKPRILITRGVDHRNGTAIRQSLQIVVFIRHKMPMRFKGVNDESVRCCTAASTAVAWQCVKGVCSGNTGREDGKAEAPEVQPAPLPGQISEEELGQMLAAMGLKPTKTEQRYDFAFKTSYRGEEWKYSMSAVLSRNGQAIWIMAWLDQIPQTSSEVPRTALLRLLAANDRLGEGKFFAYIPTNKRFVMQRVVPEPGHDEQEDDCHAAGPGSRCG